MKPQIRAIGLVMCVAMLGLALAAMAIASTKTVNDRKGDSGPGVDISSVSAVSRGKSVTWTIKAYGDFKTSAAPCVNVNPGAQKHPLGDEFNFCGSGTIHNFQHGGTAGKAKVTRPDSSTIVYRVHRSLFKAAKAISWLVNESNGACQHKTCDQAPEGPGTHVIQKL